jgi:hypothetical protein
MSDTEGVLREDVRPNENLSNTVSHSDAVMNEYRTLIQKMQDHFPKVDQRLLFDIIKYQTAYEDWDGSVLLKFVYPGDNIDLEAKKSWVFSKFNRVPSIEEDRTLRFKGIRIDLQGLEQILEEDKDIEFITGSATLTPCCYVVVDNKLR